MFKNIKKDLPLINKAQKEKDKMQKHINKTTCDNCKTNKSRIMFGNKKAYLCDTCYESMKVFEVGRQALLVVQTKMNSDNKIVIPRGLNIKS